MNYIIKLQETGQEIPVTEQIGKDDEQIKRALSGVIPYMDTARLERKVEGEKTTITVTKSHAPKGGGDSPIPFV